MHDMLRILYFLCTILSIRSVVRLENINSVVAENLKRIREERRLSLDAAAKLTGVSKSMLGQIERGEANPTVSTVWKIADGLKVSFTSLTARAERGSEISDVSEIRPLLEDDGRFRNYTAFPFDASRRFEMYYIEIDPDGGFTAEPHPQGTQEFITAFSGELTVEAGGETLTITCGSSMRFKADVTHSYKNTGREICRLSMVMYYPQV